MILNFEGGNKFFNFKIPGIKNTDTVYASAISANSSFLESITCNADEITFEFNCDPGQTKLFISVYPKEDEMHLN